MKDKIQKYIDTLRKQSRNTVADAEFRCDSKAKRVAESRAATLKRVASQLEVIVKE